MTLNKFKLVLISTILCTNAYATDSPKLINYPPQKIMGFRGLDTLTNAPLLADGRAIDLQNIKLSSTYDLEKRDGYDTVNDVSLDDLDIASPAIQGIFDATFSDGTNIPVVFVGKKVKYSTSGGWTEINDYWSTPTISSGKNYQFKCVMALDTAVCTNDTDVPLEITSTPTKTTLDTSDLTDALTKAKTVIWFRNYLIFGNTYEASTERPTRFRWSNVGTTETWSDDDYVDIAELGGDEIIAIAELYGNLYIFFKEAIYKVTLIGGNDIFSFDKVIEGYGAISRDSVQVVKMNNNQSAIMFLTKNKEILLFNGLVVSDAGRLIQPTLDDLNGARLQYVVSLYDGTSYYLAASNSTSTENDIVFEFQLEIGEWTKHTDINANAMGGIWESNQTKTYFGNYDAFVYWISNPDLKNDIDGVLGQVNRVETWSGVTMTDAQVIVDTSLPTGFYTGATVKIESGTAVGEEQVILAHTSTGLTVATAFTTTPDATSYYSIGVIDSQYETKWYDLGDSVRKKNWKELFFWAEEASAHEVTLSYKQDFTTPIDSLNKSLAPASTSLWDSAVWDEATWGTAGDLFLRIPLKSRGRFINFKFENSTIDEDFHIYGFNILADALDIR